MIASNEIAKFMPMTEVQLMIKPATVLSLVRVLLTKSDCYCNGLGAVVYATDIRPEANESSITWCPNCRLVFLSRVAVSEDRKHANNLPKEWLEKEREAIKDIVSKSDIVFVRPLFLKTCANLDYRRNG